MLPSLQRASVRNGYKRQDVFRCRHDAHAAFDSVVSAYHVLKVKGCHPEGCVQFRPVCAKISKRVRCPRGFRRPGRLCRGCVHLGEVKEHHNPRWILPEEEQEAFWRELRDFEAWIAMVRNRRASFLGTVESILPQLVRKSDHAGSRLSHRGFTLVLTGSYIGRTRVEDSVYLNVSRRAAIEGLPARGGEIEGTAVVTLHNGRVVLTRPRLEEEESRDGSRLPFDSRYDIPPAPRTFAQPPASCMLCPMGVLVDHESRAADGRRRGREIYCSAHLPSPSLCARVKPGRYGVLDGPCEGGA